jgi:flagellar hook protein FlgE
MMISGDGFFVTSLGGQQLYTRAGSFDPDALGVLPMEVVCSVA